MQILSASYSELPNMIVFNILTATLSTTFCEVSYKLYESVQLTKGCNPEGYVNFHVTIELGLPYHFLQGVVYFIYLLVEIKLVKGKDCSSVNKAIRERDSFQCQFMESATHRAIPPNKLLIDVLSGCC